MLPETVKSCCAVTVVNVPDLALETPICVALIPFDIFTTPPELISIALVLLAEPIFPSSAIIKPIEVILPVLGL